MRGSVTMGMGESSSGGCGVSRGYRRQDSGKQLQYEARSREPRAGAEKGVRDVKSRGRAVR